VKSKGDGYYRYELADDKLPDCLPIHYADAVQEYKDAARGIYRAAYFSGQRLEAVMCIAPELNLPERSWLSSLFSKAELEPSERKVLLTGKPPLGQADVGKIICACFNVGEKTIRAAIKEHGLTTYQQVGQCLKAGSNCGSCVPEIKALL